jgi:hypothetical protein
LDDIEHFVEDVDGPLWPWARQHASWAKMDASSYQREFYSPAYKIPHGGYGYAAGEETMVILVPEGHPAFGLDYDNQDNWSEEDLQLFLVAIGEAEEVH